MAPGAWRSGHRCPPRHRAADPGVAPRTGSGLNAVRTPVQYGTAVNASAPLSSAVPTPERPTDMMLVPTSPPPLVLVVDDDADTREIVRLCLNCSGVEAMEAGNARDALQKVSETLPHAILLDMGLPDIDGYDLCRQFRERSDTHRTPIIALTGHAYPADLQRARDAGCDGVLIKPCPPEHILLELQRVLPSHFRAIGMGDRAQDKPRVLVVDDDQGVLDVLATFLERAGFDVTTAADGVEALRVALHGFDVITTDLDMPHMDGHEFIQRLHDLPIQPIPVVLLTGQQPDESVAERAKACRIVTKPCRLGELAEALRLLVTVCSHDRFSCSTCPGSSRLSSA
jgi:two-component system, cell cycle response regulator DivK